MPSSEYTVNILIKSKDQTSVQAGKATKSLGNLKQAAKLAAGAFIALKGAQKAVDFIKLGASIQATENRFIKFAGGTAKADELLKALNESADHTLTRMTAMTTASTLFSLGLATTADEMGAAGAMLGKLARQGLGAEGAMNSLTMLLANQSTRRLDDFGLSVTEVTAKQKILEEQGLSTEKAFTTAVFDVANQKVALLGDTSKLAATKIAKTEASLTDAKNAVAEMATTILSSSGTLDKLVDWATGVADVTNAVRENGISIQAWIKGMDAYVAGGKDGAAAAAAFTEEQLKQNKAFDEAIPKYSSFHENQKQVEESTEAAAVAISDYNGYVGDGVSTLRDYGDKIDGLSYVTDNHRTALGLWIKTDNQIERGILDTIDAIQEEKDAIIELGNATRSYAMDAAADWTSYAKDVTKTAEELAADKEDIEKDHADNLIKIQAKGQATSVRIDAESEQAKLDKLKERLAIALQQESEFTDKTKESTRMSKDLAIESLQTEITGKETLLADYHAGRLVKAGQNVDGLLAEEDRRYAEELIKLNESRTEQEIAQKESLGRMVIEQWKAFALGSDLTQEEIDEVTRSFMELYGLITTEGAATADATVESFAKILKYGKATWDGIEEKRQRYQDNLAAMAEKTFDVRIRTIHETVGASSPGATIPGIDPGMASGGTARGGTVMVGELGPERVRLPRGSQVTPASQTTKNYTFNQTVNTRATSHSIMDDWALAEALAA